MRRWCAWCRPSLIWPVFGILAIVGTVGACAGVEADVEARSRAALDEIGLVAVEVSDVRYREVELSGPADDEADAVAAVGGLVASRTVRYVTSTGVTGGEVATSTRMDLSGVLDAGQVVLSGTVPDQNTRDAIVDAATGELGAQAVTDELSVDGIEASDDLAAAARGLAELFPSLAAGLASAEFSLVDTDLTLTGMARSAAPTVDVEAAARESTAFGSVTVEIAEAVTQESAATPHVDLIARVTEDGVTLDGSVPDESSRQTMVAAAGEAFGAENVADGLTVDGVESTPELSAALMSTGALLSSLAVDLVSGEMSLVDSALTVSGEAGDEAGADRVRRAIAEVGLPATVEVTATASAARDELEPTVEPEPAPEQVEADIAQLLEIENITFETNSSVITDAGRSVIDRVVAVLAPALEADPDLTVRVEGHTDSTGESSYNQTLSEARAAAVVDRLVESGLPSSVLTSAGFGEGRPVEDNGSSEGRAANRRIEFVIEEG